MGAQKVSTKSRSWLLKQADLFCVACPAMCIFTKHCWKHCTIIPASAASCSTVYLLTSAVTTQVMRLTLIFSVWLYRACCCSSWLASSAGSGCCSSSGSLQLVSSHCWAVSLELICALSWLSVSVKAGIRTSLNCYHFQCLLLHFRLLVMYVLVRLNLTHFP